MPSNPTIRLRRLDPERYNDIPLPRYMTPLASGMDVCAAPDTDVKIEPGSIAVVPTGLAMAIPEGFEVQVRPRSGLAAKHGISIINTPGTIDADYRGEVRIAVINLGPETFTIHRGDRIAQMVVQRVYQARLDVVEDLGATQREDGGFGHTGR